MSSWRDELAELEKLEEGATPGPWFWADEFKTIDGRKTWSLVRAGGFGILSCDGEENSPHRHFDMSNVDLITAAPRMMALLRRMAEEIEMLEKNLVIAADTLECLRRCHGIDVGAICIETLNEVRPAADSIRRRTAASDGGEG